MICCEPTVFAGVQAPVDPNDGAAFFRKRAGLGLGHALRMRELGGNLLVVIELGDILRRRNDRHVLVPALSRQADVDQFHAV